MFRFSQSFVNDFKNLKKYIFEEKKFKKLQKLTNWFTSNVMHCKVGAIIIVLAVHLEPGESTINYGAHCSIQGH